MAGHLLGLMSWIWIPVGVQANIRQMLSKNIFLGLLVLFYWVFGLLSSVQTGGTLWLYSPGVDIVDEWSSQLTLWHWAGPAPSYIMSSHYCLLATGWLWLHWDLRGKLWENTSIRQEMWPWRSSFCSTLSFLLIFRTMCFHGFNEIFNFSF